MARIESLSPERQALVRKLLEQRRQRGELGPAGNGPRVLSSAQRRLWFLHRLDPNRCDYALAGLLRFAGTLDPQALAAALAAVLDRHEILRARIIEGDPPTSTLVERAPVELALREESGEARARVLADQPFDLERGPLVRFELCRVHARLHELVIVAHHLICDGGSLRLFADELSAHYRSQLERGRPAELEPLALQYTDFAAWEQRRATSDELAELERWWLARLGDHVPPPLVPGRGRVERELAAERVGFTITPAQLVELDARAAELASTRFAILTAALFAALVEAHPRRELWIGSPVAGRERAELQRLIGLFVNTVVIRARVDETTRIADLCEAVRDELRAVLAHAELPFDRLVERLRPDREQGGTPLLQAAISLQESAPRFELGPDLSAHLEGVFTGRVTIELLLVLRPNADGGLDGWFEYARERFDAVAIAALVEGYASALHACVAQPERALRVPALAQATPERVCSNLSPTQRAMWMGQRMHVGVPIYNQQLICRIDAGPNGPLDSARFAQAFADVVASNDALRTVIELHEGVPRQRSLAIEAGPPLEAIRLAAGPEGEVAARALFRRRGARAFDLERGLVDSLLVWTGSERCWWCLTLHHLITDGWSFALILERTFAAYRRLGEAGADPSPPGPSFTALLESLTQPSGPPPPNLERARRWWQDLPIVPSPAFFGQRREPEQTAVVRVRVALDGERSAALIRVSQRAELRSFTPALALANLFTTLIAGLVHRLSGERELCVGVPMHNRGSALAKQTIGALMVVCPIRVTVPERASLATLALEVGAAMLDALKQLKGLDGLRADRRPYDVMVNYLDLRFAAFEDLPTRVEMTGVGHALDTLTVNVEEREGKFVFDLDLALDVFDEHRRAIVKAELERLIEAAIADFEGPLHGRPVLEQVEPTSSDLLGLWSAIEAQARARPDAIAIVDGRAQLSRSALVRRARAWAEQLQQRGVGPGRLVAVALPRSLDQVVAILAVLACGGGYVPIDPCRESARLRDELAVVAGGLVLIRADQRERFAEFELELLAIESLGSTPIGSPLPRPCASAPVYAMHTSGTSGRPHAVIIEQRGLANHARWASERFALSAHDRVLQFADLGFDTAAEELFPTLLSGATLVLRDADTLAAPARFWRACRTSGIGVVDLPTAYWHVLVSEGELSPAQLGAVRLVVIGGERAERGATARWQTRIAGACELLNTYGPTEATIVSTAYGLRPDSLGDARELPIGEPIPGSRAEVIAEADFPARALIEVPGELYIGGVGLASGYAGNPRLTAERFVPDPRGPAGGRLYRTGDRVRLARDGQLEYLGRRDRQLKLRGIRIEPLGLERALLDRPEVAAAAVVGTGFDRPGAARLWAFMVPALPAPPPAASVVAGLAPPGATLRGEWIEALPLTARGKLDLAALQARADAAMESSETAADEPASHEAATTLARLRGLWAALLVCDAASITDHDDFFALGGHSLLGVMLMARITRAFGVELALRRLFEHPRLADLAAAIDRAEPGETASASEPLRPIPNRGARAPLSPAQERLWFLDQLDPGNPTWNVPAAIELIGDLDNLDNLAIERLQAAFSALIRRHEILRTSFEIHEGEPSQVVHQARPLTIPVVEFQHESAAIEARARAHAGLRFDLARGPLIAAELLRCQPRRHVLLLAVHHIVADGWSVGVLVRELWAMLAALERGVDPARVELELAPLPVQYADHAIWQRARLAGPSAREHRDWWRANLDGAAETIALPFDHPRPASERHRGASLALRFDDALVERLRAFARANEATPYMVSLAAFAALLAQLGKQSELCIGSPVAGRDDPACEGLIGFFVNTLVLRLRLDGNPTFTDLVRRVRATCLDALARRETPFEAIVEDLRPQRSLARQPLFQVMFTFLNEPTRRELDGPSPLAWRALEFDRGTANRDLTLRIEERGQGLVGHFEYNTDLFEPGTIASWAARLAALLSEALAEPGKRLASLAGERRSSDERRDAARSRHDKFLAARGRERPRGPAELFTTRPLCEDRRGPLVFEPRVRDLDPHAWLAAERDRVTAALEQHGGVLLRGLPIDSPDEFARLCRLLTPDLMDYDEQSTPRTTLAKHVYTSTEYPAQSRIMPHNEMAYASHWPRRLWFFCRRPAREGGESPLVDSALVRARIDAGLRERFEARGVCYMRNYRERLDLPWQRVFGTDDRAIVEAHCRSVGTELEWSADGGLRTWDRSAACAREPVHGERVWFNSAHMFHVSSLDPEVRAALRALFADEELPRHAWFGDGSVIEDEAIAHIRQVYRDESIMFSWQRGDVLLIDNLRFAHGREPFTGARELLVAMACPSADRALADTEQR